VSKPALFKSTGGWRVFVKVRCSFAISLLSVVAAAGCGSAADEDTGTISQWLGDSPHFAVSGTFNGKPMNYRAEGAAATGLRCTRTFGPLPGAKPDASGNYDTSQIYFVKKELGMVVDIDGTPTDISVGYWRHDAPAGTDMEVIPRVRGTAIPQGKTWVDFELKEPGSSAPTGIEKAAESGAISIKLNSGSPDQNGIFVASGGRTGEFVNLSWGPEETLTISATADCTTDAAWAVWAPGFVLP
jgi:hypothetical protein